MGKGTFSDQALAKVVQQYPLYIEEIKYIARQTTIRSIVRSSCTTPDMKCIMEVVSGYRKKVEAPVLFGGAV
jgi:hypothetical protein